MWIRGAIFAGMAALVCAAAAMARQGSLLAQASGGAAAPAGGGAGAPAGGQLNIFELFQQSFDLFTVLLLVASLVAWSIIVITIIEVREKNILPVESEEAIRTFAAKGQWGEVRKFAESDTSFVSAVVLAGMVQPGDSKDAVRNAAELAASEQCAKWFRKIEPLNVIGNMGPLLGLAGTVWGMVIAFAALGQSGGQASPATLSLGVSKALFHTLLGLLLAVPALGIFGFYRSRIDRLCNRAMMVSAALVELLPASGAARRGAAPALAAPVARPAHPPAPGAVAPAEAARAS